MPCQPISSANITPPALPSGSNVGGFAPQIPNIIPIFTNKGIPALNDVFDTISALMPSGTFNAGLSPNWSKDALDGILSVMEKLSGFLTLYKFIIPGFNIILCVIEILCLIPPSPFNIGKFINAMVRLFTQCIPEFISIFPPIALILIIVSLLLLVIALIIYILARILEILSMILKNVQDLTAAAVRLNQDSILAITRKIGDLLCLFTGIFTLLGFILSVFNIIKALMAIGFGIPPCSDSGITFTGIGGVVAIDGCCTPDVCPGFVRNNPNGIPGTNGILRYYNKQANDGGVSVPSGFPKILSVAREESWQFYDPTLTEFQQFSNIIAPIDFTTSPRIFFPEGMVYNQDTPIINVPYSLEMRFFYDPVAFARVDSLGARFLRAKDIIISKKPNFSPIDGSNQESLGVDNGVLYLIGGSIYEDNGSTPVILNGEQARINTLIHLDPNESASSLSESGGVVISNISYTFHINAETMAGLGLISVSCTPRLSSAKDFVNNTTSSRVTAILPNYKILLIIYLIFRERLIV